MAITFSHSALIEFIVTKSFLSELIFIDEENLIDMDEKLHSVLIYVTAK